MKTVLCWCATWALTECRGSRKACGDEPSDVQRGQSLTAPEGRVEGVLNDSRVYMYILKGLLFGMGTAGY